MTLLRVRRHPIIAQLQALLQQFKRRSSSGGPALNVCDCACLNPMLRSAATRTGGVCGKRQRDEALIVHPKNTLAHVCTVRLFVQRGAAATHGIFMQAVFLTFGLHTQLGYVIRTGAWLGAWFVLMSSPRHWADEAERWNRLAAPANVAVWNEKFETVHYYMSRALLAYLLLCFCGLLRAGMAKYLSLKFHHRNHFESMQKALVQENVVQALSKPNRLASSALVTIMDRTATLKGMDCAHWAALKFVSRIVESDARIFGQVDQCSNEKLEEIKVRSELPEPHDPGYCIRPMCKSCSLVARAFSCAPAVST